MAQGKTLSRTKNSEPGLTTHVLDTASGLPAAGVKIALYRLGDERLLLASTSTNDDGRCDGPLLAGDGFTAGRYELVFHVGDYFDAMGRDLPEPKFIDEVVIRFGISDGEAHYHVPILVSPFAYSTYRGS